MRYLSKAGPIAVSCLLLLSCASGKGTAPPSTPLRPLPAPSAGPAPSASHSLSAFAASCAEDDEIEPATRTEITTVARRFLTDLLEPDAAGAVDFLSTEAKASGSRSGLVEAANAIRKELEPRELTIDRTDLVRVKGHAPDRVVCARDLSKADGWESVKIADIPQQAHVLFSAASRKERVAMVVWLIPEDASWRVQGFSVNLATSGGRNALQLYELAKGEREGGRLFNATLLLGAAGAMAERGPYYQMSVSQAIRTEQATLDVPAAITGKPPWPWNGALGDFTILGLGPLSVAGKIVVAIDHDVPSGFTMDEMVQANSKLLADFKRRFPEYTRIFAGTVVRAHLHGTDRGYASVDEVH